MPISGSYPQPGLPGFTHCLDHQRCSVKSDIEMDDSHGCYLQEENSKRVAPDPVFNDSLEGQRDGRALTLGSGGDGSRGHLGNSVREKRTPRQTKLEQHGRIGCLWPQWLSQPSSSPLLGTRSCHCPIFRVREHTPPREQSRGPCGTVATTDCSWGLLLFKGSLLLGC